MVMVNASQRVTFKDSTLREGLDTPGVSFSVEQKLRIAKALDQAGVPEIEIVAPSRVMQDVQFASILKGEKLQVRTSGLVYANHPRWQADVEAAAANLDRFDVLMPVSPKRKPCSRNEKTALLAEVLEFALAAHPDVGMGFPHSTQVEAEFLAEIARLAAQKGAKRVTIYDTNGGSDPFALLDLIGRLRKALNVFLLFHGHNDLGLAVANSVAAVYAGADGLDVTVNGLGDRAGNASLEQVAMALHVKGFRTGIALQQLPSLSRTVEEESGVKVSKLAPVIGEYVLSHVSASHLEQPDQFEAFDPQLIGGQRKVNVS
jgi:isopropylmalate/homocitrate/citramalate synthase